MKQSTRTRSAMTRDILLPLILLNGLGEPSNFAVAQYSCWSECSYFRKGGKLGSGKKLIYVSFQMTLWSDRSLSGEGSKDRTSR